MCDAQDGRQTGLRDDGGPDDGGPVRAGEVRAEQPADPHRDAHREDGDTGDVDADSHEGGEHLPFIPFPFGGGKHDRYKADVATFDRAAGPDIIVCAYLDGDRWFLANAETAIPVALPVAIDSDLTLGNGDSLTFRVTIGFPHPGRRGAGDGTPEHGNFRWTRRIHGAGDAAARLRDVLADENVDQKE